MANQLDPQLAALLQAQALGNNFGNQAHQGGINGNLNLLADQMNGTGAYYRPSLWDTMLQQGGYGYNLGNAIGGAMGQMNDINQGNANRNALENQTMGQYRAAVDPVAIQEAGKTARTQNIFGSGGLSGVMDSLGGGGTGLGGLSGLLSGILGGPSGGIGGNTSGGLKPFSGFQATDGNGNPSSSASLPAGQAAAPAPGGGGSAAVANAGQPSSTAQHTEMANYLQDPSKFVSGPANTSQDIMRRRLAGGR